MTPLKKTYHTCDIVMPVYNNSGVLPYTVEALFSQDIPTAWHLRLVASDDGSVDNSVSVIRQYIPTAPWPILITQNNHSGPAAARNRALERTTAGIIFFLGADILLRPGALAAHLNFHASHPDPQAAALGFVAWDPRLNPSPFMEWMVHSGPQNNFDDLLGRATADPRHFFYASHLSIKRSMLPPCPFPEVFTGYGWEDLALGRRLADQKLTLHVLSDALALHRHQYSVSDIIRRQARTGAGLKIYQEQFPNEQLYPRSSWVRQIIRSAALKVGILYLLAAVAYLSGRYSYSFPGVFARLTSLAFWAGVNRR